MPQDALQPASGQPSGALGGLCRVLHLAGLAAALILGGAGVSALAGRSWENVLTGAATLAGLLLTVGAVARLARHRAGWVGGWVAASHCPPLRWRWVVRGALLLLLAALVLDRADNRGGPPKAEAGVLYRQVADGVFEPVEEATYQRLAALQAAVSQLFVALLAGAAAAAWHPAASRLPESGPRPQPLST